MAGLGAVPDSRRLGEYLQQMSVAGLSGLQTCARQASGRLLPQLVRGCLDEWGLVFHRSDDAKACAFEADRQATGARKNVNRRKSHVRQPLSESARPVVR